jgi:hypothetical protein
MWPIVLIAGIALFGSQLDPFQEPHAKAVVLVFVRGDCPISNRYAPELQRLYREFSSRGVTFWMVYPDPGETLESAGKHAKEYGLPGTVWLDPRHAFVKLARARTTPEAAVFAPGKRLVYHGRIDDLYVSFGKARSAATTHEVEAALQAVLNGKTLPRATAPAIGCAIADLK